MDSSVGNAAFLQGKLDMSILYLNVELPLYEEKTGKKFPVLKFSDWGVPVPGLSIVATRAGIQNRGDVFKRVLAANEEAMLAAAKDTVAAVAATQKSWPTAPSASIVASQVEATMAAVTADVPGMPVGWVSVGRIASARKILDETQKKSDLPDSAFFTNDLLGK
jgi:NitT/TauT family transport system substrate-binding protein